ncbi:hypothetical protein BDV96DRAFT_612290 [Lophiotrema nucula]|uniref:Integral membrane protein n=1 Tax=Lophiotrema nucula TaxID=690887 RepID=A0A6A5ZAG1_9PLEO|nr:hypothetical protein BDV96DRAFT_612290 [Lophiotrema nucula]
MAPIENIVLSKRFPVPSARTEPPSRSSLTVEGGFLEAWAQGYNVGSLIILILIVFCNYRSGIFLHKIILLELVLALWHGTFIFVDDPAYGWYLSTTATLLFISYQLHNVVSWLKIRPFLPKWGSRVFIFSLLLVQPFWIVEAWSNFEYFNSLGNNANERTRPWEALVRDPWWIFTTWKLIDVISKTYDFRLWTLIKLNRRFGVMLACMFISIAFLLTDVVVSALRVTKDSGINPYWRFALVFKCASDVIFLDDFKSVLDDIIEKSFNGNAHRRGTYHRTQGGSIPGRKGSSFRGGEDFIECGPMTNVTTPKPPPHSRLRNPFKPHDRNTSVPNIRIQKETTITSESRKASEDTCASDRHILSVPQPTHYGHKKDNSSTGSVSIVHGGPGG